METEENGDRKGWFSSCPDNVENIKEAGGEAQDTQGLSKNCASREGMFPPSSLIRGFVISIIDPPLGG